VPRDETEIDPAMRRQIRSRDADQAIARLAARQHRMVARWQLLDAGLTKHAIDHRVRMGRLVIVYPGVYALGPHPLSARERWMAAVLAGGRHAVLSHRSAVELWGLRKPSRQWPHITLQSSRPKSETRIVWHAGRLRSGEVTRRHGIPVTTVARTLLDFAALAPRSELGAAFREAESKRWITPHRLGALVERNPRRRGARDLRAVLADAGWGTGITRSDLEADFRAFLRRHRLPPPDRNVHMRIGALEIEADCVWWDARLIVELDSREYHDTASAFQSDRARDRVLMVHGWRCTRVTPRHLERDAHQLARDLRALLRMAA
jgi:very-short-patch-repair endonuclease